MGVELEYKYGLTAPLFAVLNRELPRRFPGQWQEIDMQSRYYDTADRYLSAQHITLRLRQEDGRQVLTMKAPGKGPCRQEWELPGGDLEQVQQLATLGAPPAVLERLRNGVQMVCGARFTRRRKLATLDTVQMELALDDGFLLGGGAKAPFRELEAEWKGGAVEPMEDWCRGLAREYGLRLELRSKFARAMALAERQRNI